MNELLSPGTPEEVVPLNELMPPVAPTTGLPEASARNRAATAALFTEDVKGNYDAIMAEDQQGQTNVVQSLETQAKNSSDKLDITTMIGVLGDKAVPLETKKRLIGEFAKRPQFNLTTELHNKALEADAKLPRDEDVARITLADQSRKAEQAREQIEGMLNTFYASLDSSTAKGVSDIGAAVVPLSGNIIAGRISKGEGNSLWQSIKDGAWQPGYKQRLKDKFTLLPPDEKITFVQNLINSVKENAGVVFPGSNHYAAYQFMREITEEGHYGNIDKAADAVATVLDVVGMGMTLRSAKGVAKGVTKTPLTPSGVSLPEKFGSQMGPMPGPKGTASPSTVSAPVPSAVPAPSPTVTSVAAESPIIPKAPPELVAKREALSAEYKTLLEVNDTLPNRSIFNLSKQKDELEKKLSTLKDETKQLAESLQKGGKLTSKEAKAEASKRIGDQVIDAELKLKRVNEQMAGNTDAAKVQQRLGAIESEMVTLDKRIIAETKATPAKRNYVLEAYDQAKRLELNYPVRADRPSTPLHVFAQTNPQKYRATMAAVVEDVTDETAKAASAATRTETIASAVMPQVVTGSGRIAAKVIDPFRDIAPLESTLKSAVEDAGSLHFEASEVARAKENFTTAFKGAEGVHPIDGMGGFGITQDGAAFNISATYGTNEGAFSNAKEAIDQTLFALKKTGASEKDIVLMKKDGLDYVPTTLEAEAGKEGSYLVKLEGRFPFDYNDIGNFNGYDVKLNWTDRIMAMNKSHVSRNFIDPASMLPPVFSQPLGTSLDRIAYVEKNLLRFAYEYTDKVKDMPAPRRKAIDDYLKKANEQGIPFDATELRVKEGFSPEEVDAIHTWKVMGDQQYHLENQDLVKSLIRDKFEKYVGTTGDEFIARPIGRGGDIGKIPIALNQSAGRIYDPVTGASEFVTRTDTDMWYKAGGTYAELKRPVEIDGELVTHIRVRQSPEGYLRKLNSNDQVLNYRPMHYTRYYDAPIWVDEITSKGRRAIAVGPDIPSAEHHIARMSRENPDKKYVYRNDARGQLAGANDMWDMDAATGRIAQRHRGKVLGTTDSTTVLGDGSFVLDPTNSAIRAAQSLSGRIATREVIETAKARVVAQHGHMFPEGRFPTSTNQIYSKGDFSSSELADARTAVGNILYLEDAHINAVDAAYKNTMNVIANTLGKYGAGTAERIVRKGENITPTQTARSAVFQAYIVWGNFVRQFVLQSVTGLRTLGYNTKNWANGQMSKDLLDASAWFFNPDHTSPFVEFVKKAGIIDSVDRHTLVSGALSDIAEQRNAISTAGRTALVEIPRKIGFDFGENANQLMWHSAVYRKMEAEGLDMTTKDNRQAASAMVRALTGEMNKAGEMGYNAGMLSLLTQFMQMPHKAALMYTNRKIPTADKLKLAATDLVLWGPPIAVISNMFAGDVLPEDDTTRYMVSQGLVAHMYNEIFQGLSGEDENLDFKWLSPYGYDGWHQMLFAVTDGGFNDMLKKAPAYSLLSPEKGRVPIAIKEWYRLFSGDIENDLPEATMKSVLQRTAEIASGYSHFAKAHAALESDKRRDKYGNPLIGTPTPGTVFMSGFGVETLNQKQAFELSMAKSVRDKDFEDVVTKDYKETRRIVTAAMSGTKEDYVLDLRATNILMNRWANIPEAQKIIMKLRKRDAMTPGDRLTIGAMRNAGIPDAAYTPDQIKQLPVDDETKQILLRRARELVETQKNEE